MITLGNDKINHSPSDFILTGYAGAEIQEHLKVYMALREEQTEISPLSTETGKKQVVILQKMEELKKQCDETVENIKTTKDNKLKDIYQSKLELLTDEMRALNKQTNEITADALLNPETIKANNDKKEKFYSRGSKLFKEIWEKKVEITKLYYSNKYPAINAEELINQSSAGQLSKLIEAIIEQEENCLMTSFFTLLTSKQAGQV